MRLYLYKETTFVSSAITTIVGIALLSVLCDVILPDGSTKKYIRTVTGVVVTLVVVKCVLRFVGLL